MKEASSPEAVVEAEVVEKDAAAPEEAVERLLAHLPPETEAAPLVEAAAPATEAPPALRTARVVSVGSATVKVTWRGRREPVEADLDEGVDRDLIARAATNGDAVLLEIEPGVPPIVVGVVQTRIPETLELKAQNVVIDAEREVLLRAGRGAMRIREDGDVEVVGSRISTMSRGLFRIVGRVLRLN
jgi:hypothetical protein